MSPGDSWEDEAPNWIAWARTPEHDIFPLYIGSFLEDLLPPSNGLTLEIGCGEGRVSRALAAKGHHVVGIDASPTLVGAARKVDVTSTYLISDATHLPVRSASFGTVVAYNSLQTMALVDDMAKAVGEAGRALVPGGRLCIVVAHPMTDAARIQRTSRDAPLMLSGSYFENRYVNETVTKDDLTMTFHGWTYTLEDYTRAMEDAGLLIERVREPLPDRAQTDASPGEHERLPLFLFIRAVKPA